MEHSEYIRTRSREDRERKNLSPPAKLRRQLYRTNNLIKSAATRSSGILLRWGHRKPETTGLKVLHWTQIAGDKLGWAFVPEDHVFLAFSVRTSSKFPVFEINPPAFRSGGDKAQKKKQKQKKQKKLAKSIIIQGSKHVLLAAEKIQKETLFILPMRRNHSVPFPSLLLLLFKFSMSNCGFLVVLRGVGEMYEESFVMTTSIA